MSYNYGNNYNNGYYPTDNYGSYGNNGYYQDPYNNNYAPQTNNSSGSQSWNALKMFDRNGDGRITEQGS